MFLEHMELVDVFSVDVSKAADYDLGQKHTRYHDHRQGKFKLMLDALLGYMLEGPYVFIVFLFYSLKRFEDDVGIDDVLDLLEIENQDLKKRNCSKTNKCVSFVQFTVLVFLHS